MCRGQPAGDLVRMLFCAIVSCFGRGVLRGFIVISGWCGCCVHGLWLFSCFVEIILVQCGVGVDTIRHPVVWCSVM